MSEKPPRTRWQFFPAAVFRALLVLPSLHICPLV
nr:MAG TPA: hypothetical protein [Inoviridae sp.]